MPTDNQLIQIVDAALAEAARRSGAWLVCRPGCSQCCLGDFAITPLDAARLRRGLAELAEREPERAQGVRERVHAALAREPHADEEACPVLDPETGTCDLYSARPIMCRVFGPPVRSESGDLGVCELCFEGASADQIAACAVDFDPSGVEADLLRDLGDWSESTVTRALSEV